MRERVGAYKTEYFWFDKRSSLTGQKVALALSQVIAERETFERLSDGYRVVTPLLTGIAFQRTRGMD